MSLPVLLPLGPPCIGVYTVQDDGRKYKMSKKGDNGACIIWWISYLILYILLLLALHHCQYAAELHTVS